MLTDRERTLLLVASTKLEKGIEGYDNEGTVGDSPPDRAGEQAEGEGMEETGMIKWRVNFYDAGTAEFLRCELVRADSHNDVSKWAVNNWESIFPDVTCVCWDIERIS